MRPVKKIKKYIKNVYANELKVSASSKLDKRVFANVMNALEQQKKKKPDAVGLNIRRKIMKTRISKIAVAGVFIAVIIGLHQFRISIDGTSVAWADVAERLEKVSSYTAKASRVFTEVGKEEPILDCNVFRYFSPDHGVMERQYIEGELGMLSYGLLSEKLVIFVLPQSKQYFRLGINEEMLSIIEYINPANTDGIMKLFGSERCTRLGSREINGVRTEGFEVKDVKVFSSVPRILFQIESIDMRLWVDPKTYLPIEAEMEGFIGKGVLTGFKDFHVKEVVYDFEYDVEINESIFEPNIPDDYTELTLDLAAKVGILGLGILPLPLGIIMWKRLRKAK